jgi:TetR/AcrR family transcriptional regulator
MGINERKEREKQRRRKDILDAAEKVFFSKGVETATMDEVAATAELSKGTLYLYFKNKGELLHGINGRALEVLLKTFKKAIAKEKIGLEKVKALGDSYYEFYKKHPDYFSLMLHRETTIVDPTTIKESPNFANCNVLGDEIFKVMQEAVGFGIKDGTIRQDVDPFKLSMVLWGHTSGILNLIRSKELFFETKFPITVEEYFEYSRRLTIDYLIARK